MKAKSFYYSYIALIIFFFLSVSNVAAGVADLGWGIAVDTTIVFILLAGWKKFHRMNKVVMKKMPEVTEDAPMNLEV